MHNALLQTIVCLFDSLAQQGLSWSIATVEPSSDAAAVNMLWHYPHKRGALRIMESPGALDQDLLHELAARLRRSIEADEYRLILLGDTAGAQAIDGVTIELADRQGLRERAIERIGRRDPSATLTPATIGRDALLDAMVRKLAGYAGLSLEIAAISFDQALLNWRSLFDSQEQQQFGEGDRMERRRWRNLEAMAQECGATPARIEDAVEGLPARHARILRLRYGIGRLGDTESAASVADILEIDPARFPTIEQAAVDALRGALARQTEQLFAE